MHGTSNIKNKFVVDILYYLLLQLPRPNAQHIITTSNGLLLLLFPGIKLKKYISFSQTPFLLFYISQNACLLIPCSSVLLEKLTDFHLVKKSPSFYGIRRFITAFTSACHLSLSSVSSIQSILPHPAS
jgi:hypothetical protein